MYKYFGILCCLFLLSCETEKKQMEIKGSVVGAEYENELVYLVPLKGVTAETVDSTYIKEGRFSFSLPIDSPEIRIIRTRPILRLKLQELLVVAEPGSIAVELNSVSRAQGTPLNNRLQAWKDKKTAFDEAWYAAGQDENKDPTALKNDLSEIKKAFSEYNFKFVQENKANIVGLFVFEITRGSFSPEQRHELEEPDSVFLP